MSDGAPLYMTKMALSQPALMRLGRQKGLPMREVDTGYLVHCLLGELFGDASPQPFDIRDASGRSLEVLAYTTTPRDQLEHHADAFADPERHEALDWDRLHQKQMPAKWPVGIDLAFEVRACPVVRAANDTEHYSQGSEVDAFLTRCAEAEEEEEVPGREEVYRDWLEDQLARRGGVDLHGARMNSFKLRTLTRRSHDSERTARVFKRPDVRMSGTLRVAEPDEFNGLLETGLGRHRAFGFGMVLLRPTS